MPVALPPDAPRPSASGSGPLARTLERLLPAVFVVGGVALLVRGETLTGSGALLVVPAALEGARGTPSRERTPSWVQTLVALLALAGVALFVVGWTVD